MSNNSRFSRLVGMLAGLGLLGMVTTSPAAEVDIVVTNRVDRWITNVILVTMPYNLYVEEYRTNWSVKMHTNVVDRYATNVIQRTVTNEILVNTYVTNPVKAYRTNLSQITLTNWETVVVVQTNWLPQWVTNLVTFQAYATNLVTAYHTNLVTLMLTNWENVPVMKTNWVTQRVTNVVGIEASTSQVAEPTSSQPTAASRSEPPVSATKPPALLASDLVLEATLGNPVPQLGHTEVLLSVRSSALNAPALTVRQWRVQRDDGSVISFGQDRVFKGVLPMGGYQVEVQAHSTNTPSLLVARGTLAVTAHDISIQPKPVTQ